jgi:hypothetical protein
MFQHASLFEYPCNFLTMPEHSQVSGFLIRIAIFSPNYVFLFHVAICYIYDLPHYGAGAYIDYFY